VRLHHSPLGPELDAAREDATCEVVELIVRRRRPVLVTRLPGCPRVEGFRRAVAEMDDRDVVTP
jgi:hypothetical protein